MTMSLQKLNEQLNSAIATRDALQQKKAKKELTKEEQEVLEHAVTNIVDLEEEIDELESKQAQKDFATQAQTTKWDFKPKTGEEHCVHVEVSSPMAFDPNTGEQVSKPYIQLFSPKEWALVEKHQVSLSFKFKVLYKPTSK